MDGLGSSQHGRQILVPLALFSCHEAVSTQVDQVMAPFAEEVQRLDTIHGVNKRTAEVIIAEIGVDMAVFPTAGLCPSTGRRPATPAASPVRRTSASGF